MMLGRWTSWMEANSRSAQEWTDQDKPAWGVIHADELGKILASEARIANGRRATSLPMPSAGTGGASISMTAPP
jgi:hypothetical protein